MIRVGAGGVVVDIHGYIFKTKRLLDSTTTHPTSLIKVHLRTSTAQAILAAPMVIETFTGIS